MATDQFAFSAPLYSSISSSVGWLGVHLPACFIYDYWKVHSYYWLLEFLRLGLYSLIRAIHWMLKTKLSLLMTTFTQKYSFIGSEDQVNQGRSSLKAFLVDSLGALVCQAFALCSIAGSYMDHLIASFIANPMSTYSKSNPFNPILNTWNPLGSIFSNYFTISTYAG